MFAFTHKEWYWASKSWLFSLSYLDGWVKLAVHWSIQDLGWSVPCAYSILDPKIISKFERWEEEVSKFAPNFQNRLKCTMRQGALNKKFLQKNIKPM